MSVKLRLAAMAALLAASMSNPAAAATVPFAVGPLASGPGTLIWIGVTNVGSTNVTLSNAVIYTNGQQTILTKVADNCTDHVQVPGAACSFQAVMPQQNVAVWVVMQATSTTGLRGAATIVDATGRPITEVELR